MDSISVSEPLSCFFPGYLAHTLIVVVNPVPIMTLVELIPALQTHPLVLKTAQTFAEEMGKTVVTSRDSPGFISNRLLMPFINESIEVLDSGIATREDIDQTMKLGKAYLVSFDRAFTHHSSLVSGMRHPMGPLQLADL